MQWLKKLMIMGENNLYCQPRHNPMGTHITKDEFDEFYSYVPSRTLIIPDESLPCKYAKNILQTILADSM